MLIKANELTLYILTRLMRKKINYDNWWAAVYGVTQSRTRLKRLSSGSRSSIIIRIAGKLEHTPLLALSADKGLIPREHCALLDTCS